MRDIGPAKENFTRIAELDDISLLLIFEQMQLPELVSMSEASKRLSFLAADVFRRKFSKNVTITSSVSAHAENGVLERHDSIEINSIEHGKRMLKSFGNLIQSLTIGEISKWDDDIGPLINVQCTHSLVDFKVNGQNRAFFENMTIPFKELNTLVLHGEFKALQSNSITFADLFPSLRNISLRNVRTHDPRWICSYIRRL